MKPSLSGRWLSLEFYIGIFCASPGIGIICMIAGRVLGNVMLMKLGILLAPPLLAGGVLVMLVAVPVFLVANYKASRLNGADERDGYVG